MAFRDIALLPACFSSDLLHLSEVAHAYCGVR